MSLAHCTQIKMGRHANSSNPPLFVIGEKGVGKGELIKTLVEKETGQTLDITSNGPDSHTKQSAEYPFKLNGVHLVLVDTVGYDNSERNDSTSKSLKLLAESGNREFYPPLVLLRELSESNYEWLKSIRAVFPSITCAIRCKASAFRDAKRSWETSDLANALLFHLHEFQDAEVDGGRSRALYIQDLSKICSFYSRLKPTREELKFDSEIFQGKYERKNVDTETKTEDSVKEENISRLEKCKVEREKVKRLVDSHQETESSKRGTGDHVVATAATLPALGFVGRLFKGKSPVCVTDYKDVVVDDSYVDSVNVNYRKTTKTRSYYERPIKEVYVVLPRGERIYHETYKGEWKLVREKIMFEKEEKYAVLHSLVSLFTCRVETTA